MNSNNPNMGKNHDFKIFAINTNSLISDYKQFIMQKFLDDHMPDVVLVSETKLNASHHIAFKNYNIYRTDRSGATQGGGTAVIFKNNLNLIPVKYNFLNKFKLLELSIVKIKIENDNTLYFISIYVTNSNLAIFKDEINALFTDLNLNDNKVFYIIAGDLNARNKLWGDANNNQRGRYLHRWYSDKGIEFKCKFFTPQQPTYEDSFLDHCLADSRLSIEHKNNKLPVLEYDSDHNALEIKVSLNLNLDSDHVCHNFLYKSTNWDKFSKKVHSLYKSRVPSNLNLNNENIDEYLNNINKTLMLTIEKVVPRRKQYVTSTRYVNNKIRSMYKHKSYLLSYLHKIKRGMVYNNMNEENVKNLIKLLNDCIEKEFVHYKSEFWERKIRDINFKDSSTFFPNINSIFRKKKFFEPTLLKIPKDDDKLVNMLQVNIQEAEVTDTHYLIKDPDNIKNCIGKYLQDANSERVHPEHAKHLLKIINNNTEKINKTMHNRSINKITLTNFSTSNTALKPTNDNDKFTDLNTVIKKLKYLPNKTSAGPDGIPCLILKHLPISMITDITIIFNNLINNSYYPTNWKTAVLYPILKKNKDPNSVASFRPISLLPNISKIFESIIKDKINKHSSEHNILPVQQYGFRSRLSTTHAISSVTTNIYKHLLDNKLVGAILIDLEKAFDSVWLEGLLFKLCQKKFPDFLIFIIWNMVNGRNFYIRGTDPTKLFFLHHGVQQGSVSGPILFNHYFSDLLRLFGLNETIDLTADMFADDLIIKYADCNASRVQEKLNILTNDINRYCITWHFKINVDKCESILFRPPVANLSSKNKKGWRDFKIKIQDKIIPHKEIVKYLGVHLDHLMRFHKHIKIQLEKAKNALMANSNLFHSKYLNPKAKIICYMLLIRPIITYAAPVWFNTSASAMEKTRSLERSCLRSCLGLYRTPESCFQKYYSNKILYNAAAIPRIDIFILKVIREYYRLMKTIRHDVIQSSLNITPQEVQVQCTKGYVYPAAFLHLDRIGVLQNSENVPELYHISRNERNKKIQHRLLNSQSPFLTKYKYSRIISDFDKSDNTRFIKGLYWWLQNNIQDDVRRRSRRKDILNS